MIYILSLAYLIHVEMGLWFLLIYFNLYLYNINVTVLSLSYEIILTTSLFNPGLVAVLYIYDCTYIICLVVNA